MFKRSLVNLAVLFGAALSVQVTASASAKLLRKCSTCILHAIIQPTRRFTAPFTKTTGIKINRVDADDAGIMTRLKAEGAASPADLILLVDAARLTKADAEGLFQPIKSKMLDDSIPANLRAAATADGVTWTGFSTRARVIVYDKVKVKKEDVDSYEKLADPINKGKVCTRSGSHPYNLSLFSSIMEHLGEAKTEAFLKGMVDQHGARTQGWRHRPNQGRRFWRMRHCPG